MTVLSLPGGVSCEVHEQGDRTLLLVLGSDIDPRIGRLCAHVADAIRAAQLRDIRDVVPSFNTVAVHYGPPLSDMRPSTRARMDALRAALQATMATQSSTGEERIIDIPVCYGGDYGPDLGDVAAHCGISQADVIELHSSQLAYVFMLGFAPGAPYIGVHDEKLAIGRRDTPRTALPAGSVAIANRQTIIYPNVSPGGWHLIGATPVTLFDPKCEPATLLAPGDTVRFIPISAVEFEALRKQT